MNKVAIVYWSGTGNTEQMAQAVAEGVKNAGGEADVLTAQNLIAQSWPITAQLLSAAPLWAQSSWRKVNLNPCSLTWKAACLV